MAGNKTRAKALSQASAKTSAKASRKTPAKKSQKSENSGSRQPAVRAFLIGASPGATAAHTREILNRFKADPTRDLFVGVDGGVQSWLNVGQKPHMAVGDWDSYTGPEARKTLSSLHHLTLPVDKDRSDLFYAASAMVNAGATHLICLGVTGGRPDHHLASLCDLARLAAGEVGPLQGVTAYSPEGEYHFLSDLIPSWKDGFAHPRTISVFALHGPAQGVCLKGFKYAMKNAELAPSSLGLSNRSWAPACEVSMKKGNLLILIPTEDFRLSA